MLVTWVVTGAITGHRSPSEIRATCAGHVRVVSYQSASMFTGGGSPIVVCADGFVGWVK